MPSGADPIYHASGIFPAPSNFLAPMMFTTTPFAAGESRGPLAGVTVVALERPWQVRCARVSSPTWAPG